MQKDFLIGNIGDFLTDYHKRLEVVLYCLKKNLKRAPQGSLKIVKKKGGIQFYYRRCPGDKQGQYISKKKLEFVKTLAQKKHDLGIEKLVVEQRNLVTKMLKQNKEKEIVGVYESFPQEVQKLIDLVFISPETFAEKWQAVDYKRPLIDKTMCDLLTIRGEQVRSKSEIMIADALYHAGVPYRYEYPIHIRGCGTFHPDFVCLNRRTGQEVIWEHFGLMDNSEYAANALEKIVLYAQNGFVLGKGFIYTMETATRPLSSRLVNKLIECHFL